MIIIEPINLLYSGFACFGVISFAVVMGYIGMRIQHKYESDRWKDKWGE